MAGNIIYVRCSYQSTNGYYFPSTFVRRIGPLLGSHIGQEQGVCDIPNDGLENIYLVLRSSYYETDQLLNPRPTQPKKH